MSSSIAPVLRLDYMILLAGPDCQAYVYMYVLRLGFLRLIAGQETKQKTGKRRFDLAEYK